MSSVQTSSGRHGVGARNPRAQLVEAMESGVAAQLVPLLARVLEAERDALDRRMRGESPPQGGAEDIANLNIITGQITFHERRWRQRFGHPLATWPDPPKAEALDAFSLVSDDELQAQLIGQPVIEALERRHDDILDTIDKRLWSLAAAMGGQVRPENPFSPRHLVDAFLHAFTAADFSPALRGALLRQYARLAGEQLGQTYAWCNRQLSDAGVALASVGDYATLVAAMAPAGAGNADMAKLEVWGDDNALAPTDASWRIDQAGKQRPPGDAVRGNALRHQVRVRRVADGSRNGASRVLRLEEFLAALSLLQGEALQPPGGRAGYAEALRAGLSRVAGSLGIDSVSAVPSAGQEDALDVVGGLFDDLAGHNHLSAAARAGLSRLALPYLRLALDDPHLFELPPPPAMRVLSQLVALWDGNRRAGEQDAETHDLADAVAQELVDEYHGDQAVFARALERLEGSLEPLRKRAAISERRAWQAIEGRERLALARAAADRKLAARLRDRALLPTVAGFLQEQWRQSLVQAWLRGGPDSERFAAAAALGEAIVALDVDAAQAMPVADRLIDMQQRLHACYVACGVDESGANALLSGLVGELANPDTPRRRHDFTPLSGSGGGARVADEPPRDGLEPGQVLLQLQDGEPVRVLHLAWRSALSGNTLLVNAQGVRELLLPPDQMAAMLADGRLLPRSPQGPVEAALQRLEGGAQSPASG